MKCYKGGNKHNFKARYTQTPIENLKNIKTRGFEYNEIKKLFYYNTYLFDICEWCGKKIKKEESCSTLDNS